MNAVVHGGGRGESLVSRDRGGNVQVRIRDWGSGIPLRDLPDAALRLGWSSAESLGLGLTMALEAVDRLWLMTGTGGTTVVLEMGRRKPVSRWLQDAPSGTPQPIIGIAE